MPEKIYIDGFAGLKNFEMELNRITVLIGPQASGKSVVAKLVYFFNEVMIDYGKLLQMGKLLKKDFDFNKWIAGQFKDIFKINLIKNKFTIEYNWLALKIRIVQDEILSIETEGIELYDFDTYLHKMNFAGLEEQFKWINDNKLPEVAKTDEDGKLYFDFISENFFIPASRSFTSLVKKIKLLVENPDIPAAIDRFLRKFSTVYEQHREQYKKEDETLLSKETNSFDAYIKALINANVEFINDEDYLVYDNGRRVALTNASSGEQALIPVLVYLKKLHQKGKSNLKTYLFFEEPELHIFPKFQFTLMQLLMFMFNECNVRLFITTHSPYVLSVFNDMMQAAELEKIYKDNSKKLAQLYKIVPKNEIVHPEDLNAYEIENGKARLLDREYGLISENIIDKVSDEGSIKFGELLDLMPADADA